MKKSHLLQSTSALILSVAGAVYMPACAANTPESEPDPTAGEVSSDSDGEDLAVSEEAVTNCSNVECGNCVKHARCLQPALPYGLNTCADKNKIINSQTPTVGSVAVMNVGSVCHVGYVYKVTGSGSSAVIYIDEANYQAGKCGTRSGTKAQLKITGYFKP